MSKQMKIGDIVFVKWLDSYGTLSGWRHLDDFKPNVLEITSVGKVIYEDDMIASLADLLSLLPKVLHKDDLAYHYVLTIYWDEDIKVWRTIYDAIGDNIAGDCAAPELIDALYALVCDLLDNHVKLDCNYV